MNGEGRIPPLLVVGLVFLVLVIGALSYYAGRFGKSDEGPAEESAVELPPPGAPDPAVAQVLAEPAEVPPTVTPSVAVMIERETRTVRTSPEPLVERSSQIEVPVPAVIPTARTGAAAPTAVPAPLRQIVVEIVSTPLPTPTPEEVPQEEVEGEEEPPVATPGPEPTPESAGITRAGARLRSGPSGARWRSPSVPGPRTRSTP